jgi:hypothetical protein
MPNDEEIRASDQDRDEVVAVLRDAYAAGRLTLEEFDERTSAAYGGRTWGALRELTADLPDKPVFGTDLPPAKPPRLTPAPPVTERALPPAMTRQTRRRTVIPVVPALVLAILLIARDSTAGAVVVLFLFLVIVTGVLSEGRHRHHHRNGRR